MLIFPQNIDKLFKLVKVLFQIDKYIYVEVKRTHMSKYLFWNYKTKPHNALYYKAYKKINTNSQTIQLETVDPQSKCRHKWNVCISQEWM